MLDLNPEILVVDDEEELLDDTLEFLELQGFRAVACSDPHQAFQTVLDEPEIRLMITDLKMAKLDGLSLIRQTRAVLGAQRTVQFIILTGAAEPDLAEFGESVRLLRKPADTETLIRFINKALEEA